MSDRDSSGIPRIQLRDMEHGDIRSVRRIESVAYDDAWPARIFETELENGFAQYRVAVEHSEAAGGLRGLLPGGGPSDRIVGFMGLWYMIDQVHLVTIAVAPDRQGDGIGQRLLLECLDLALEAELDEVVLELRVSNTRAQRLYEYFGFRQVGTLKDYYKDNHEDAAVMLSGSLLAARPRIERIREALYAAHSGVFG